MIQRLSVNVDDFARRKAHANIWLCCDLNSSLRSFSSSSNFGVKYM